MTCSAEISGKAADTSALPLDLDGITRFENMTIYIKAAFDEVEVVMCECSVRQF